MFCPKCGRENINDARFCTGCGNPLPVLKSAPSPEPVLQNASSPVPPGINPNPVKPLKKGKGKKKWIFIGAGAAAVIIAALVVILIFVPRGLSDQDAELEYSGGYAQTYDNGDTVYVPSTETLAYDEASYTIYYDDVIIVYLNSDISDEAADELAQSVSGSVVGDISGAVNVIQIQIESTDLDGINEYAQILMESEDVMYAGYVYPMFIDELYSDSNPWSDSGEESDRGNEENPDGNDWWAEAIGAYTAWEIADSYDLVSVSVGILDSGFYLEHEDLSDDISMLSGYSTNSDTDHGTHVAGIIGADNNDIGIRGIADSATLVCADWSPVNDSDDSNYVNLVTSGEYIEIFKQMLESGVKVINNSWGCNIMSEESFENYVINSDGLDEDGNEIYSVLEWMSIYIGTYDFTTDYSIYINETKIETDQTAWESMLLVYQLVLNGYDDFLIVQAAGNGYDNSGPGAEAFWTGWFASVDEDLFNDLASANGGIDTDEFSYEDFKNHVIIVGNATSDQDSSGNYLVNEGSSWGDTVDIIAPGTNIYSTLTTSDDTGSGNNDGLIYGSLSGTSMATPMVAGSAALLWQINPDLTAAEVKALLIENCSTAVGVTGDDAGVIYPMLNIGKAAQAALETVSETKITDKTSLYQAYYDKLLEYEALWGTSDRSYDEDTSYVKLTGLCFALLIDMDGDGEEELLLGYQDSYITDYEIELELWADVDGTLTLVSSPDVASLDGGSFLFNMITLLDGTYYIVNGDLGNGGGGTFYLYSYSDGELSLSKTLVAGDEGECSIDGESVSVDEAWEMADEIYDNAGLYYFYEFTYYVDPSDFTMADDELEITLKILMDYLGIGSSSSSASSSDDWASVYLEFLEEEITVSDEAILDYDETYTYGYAEGYVGFDLIYVDDDDVPELVMYGSSEAAGMVVFTIGEDGEVDALMCSRLNSVYYAQKGNILVNSAGVSGWSFDYIYAIEDGKWVELARGDYEYYDADEDGTLEYYWNDEEVTEGEYEENLSSYEAGLSMTYTDSDPEYDLSELKSYLNAQ